MRHILVITIILNVFMFVPLSALADETISTFPESSYQNSFDRSMKFMREEMDRMFNSMFNEEYFDRGLSHDSFSSPATDLIEKENLYVVKIELPGINPEEVELTITGNSIVLTGEKQQDHEFRKDDYIRKETSFGSFRRQVSLPIDADSDKAEAQYHNGVLSITIPKNPDAKLKSRKLRIQH